MELTPGVLIVVAVVVAAAFVLIRSGRRHEAAAPVEARGVPFKGKAMASRLDRDGHSLVDWLLDRAFEQTGIRVADDALARQRVEEAAAKATEAMQAGGSATVSLPFLTADASGPKHFTVRFKRNADSTLELLH